MFKKIACFCTFLIAATLSHLPHAAAQSFPARQVKIVVGFTPGGSNDVVARVLAEHLSKMWGQPVIVENRPGANASIASTHVAGSAPDGLTLLVTPPSTMIIEHALRPKPNFDPARDLVPVVGLASVPYVLIVNTAMQVNNVSDLIALAKQKPGQINYGWANPGMRIASEIFSQINGVQLFPIGYKGARAACRRCTNDVARCGAGDRSDQIEQGQGAGGFDAGAVCDPAGRADHARKRRRLRLDRFHGAVCA
jgi:tripartite-type tricarboxylate transporter receptor subunit TctC